MSDALDESFFRRLCASTGVALIGTDEHLRVRFWNAAAERVLGGTAASMTEQPLVAMVPPERRELAARVFERTLQGEATEFEFPHRNQAGQLQHLAVTLSAIRDDTGAVRGVSVFVRDVTRRVTLAREMAAAQKMSALGAMAGAVAHHFNNLIGGIITSIDFAQSSDDPEALRRVLKTTAAALTRANRLTRGLLAFAEGERGETVMRNLTETVRQYADSVRSKLTAQGITLELDLQPVPVPVPNKRILTVLDSLVANAAEAMPNGGRVRIELTAGPEEVLLTVSDTGPGIAPEHLSHVFEPFFTTKGTERPPSSEHSGLGLAVVHGIVKELGGSAAMGASPEGGTSCTIRLPVRAEEE